MLFIVTFEVEGENILSHRILLAANNEKLRAMLTGPMVESKLPEIHLKGISSKAFQVTFYGNKNLTKN